MFQQNILHRTHLYSTSLSKHEILNLLKFICLQIIFTWNSATVYDSVHIQLPLSDVCTLYKVFIIAGENVRQYFLTVNFNPTYKTEILHLNKATITIQNCYWKLAPVGISFCHNIGEIILLRDLIHVNNDVVHCLRPGEWRPSLQKSWTVLVHNTILHYKFK